ncbi:beta-ketoacyl synthase N-terminal-like domain-containing protein [Myxococcota bacterium]
MPLEAAITGIGVVTPKGVGRSLLSEYLQTGRPVRSQSSLAEWAPAWDKPLLAAAGLALSSTRRMDPLSVRAVVAARLALADAGFPGQDGTELDPGAGAVFGTAYGCQTTTLRYARKLADQGPCFANPIDFPDSIDGAAAAHMTIECGLGGPSMTVLDGEVAGERALQVGALMLGAGRVTRVVVTAGDQAWQNLAAPTPGLASMGHPQCGWAPDQLAAALVLETRSGAASRGARVHALLCGFGWAAESHGRSRGYPSRPETYCRAISEALSQAQLPASRVGVFSRAAAGWKELDRVELEAIELQWANHRLPRLAVLRNLLGYTPSDGVVRVAGACLGLQAGWGQLVLHQGAALGGQCASLLLRRP